VGVSDVPVFGGTRRYPLAPTVPSPSETATGIQLVSLSNPPILAANLNTDLDPPSFELVEMREVRRRFWGSFPRQIPANAEGNG